MEKLDFKFPENEFFEIPTTNFHGFHEIDETYNDPETKREIFYNEEKYETKEKLEFSSHPNKENLLILNNKTENPLANKTLQKVKFDLANLKPPNKKLIASLTKKPKNKKQSSSNKFIKPVKKTNSQKVIKKEWNDDNKTTGIFQKMESIQVNEERIMKRNESKSIEKKKFFESKEEKERKKYKTHQTPESLEESLNQECKIYCLK